jgi:hypothetical protein
MRALRNRTKRTISNAPETTTESSGGAAQISLTNLTQFPPGGYRYREVALNWEMPQAIAMLGLDDAVKALQMVRAQNPASGLSPLYADCLEAVQRYTCARLNNDPRWCGLPPAEAQKIDRSQAVSGRRCHSCGRR